MHLAALLGLLSYLLLSASLTTGLASSRRAARWSRAHEWLSLGGLGAGALHGLDSLPPGDLRLAFTLPLPVSAGSLALALAVLVAASFYLRRRLRPVSWRWLHRAAFPAFALATWHGLATGADLWLPPVRALFSVCLGAVLAAAALRLAGVRPRRRSRRAAG